jgi:RNA-binding protein
VKGFPLEQLKGFQKQYLKGLAHSLKPIIQIGQNGVTPALCKSILSAFDTRELIKMKFVSLTERDEKFTLAEAIAEATKSIFVSALGKTALFYRRHPEVEKRKIKIPVREKCIN